MVQQLALVSLLVRDYDEAIDFYTNKLGFRLQEDSPQGQKRWVVVAPAQSAVQRSSALLLAKASTPQQQALIGGQGAGRVWLFLQTDDFWRDYQRMKSAGVKFQEEPRSEEYGTVVVFADLYGNLWDLIERKGV
jgi:catechol 2,3-dioxygenase-like lactoylglutathione lyase family enzyme